MAEQNIDSLAYPDSNREWKKTIAEKRYAGAVALHAHRELSWALWRAGVPVRVGLLSKPSSFLLYNAGEVQHRSRAERGEGEYNLDLVKDLVSRLGLEKNASVPLIELPKNENASDEAASSLAARGIKGKSFLLCHPGMGGSALNLSAARYLALVDDLAKKSGLRVLFSEGPNDRDVALGKELQTLRPSLEVIRGLSLPGLAELFRSARVVIAPSTGPLHLAHLVGTETIGVYSPVLSHHPRRWRPWGGKAPVQILTPQVDCPADRECLREKCPHHPCLERMEWSGLKLSSEQV